MDERKLQFRVGIVVLAAAIVTVFLVILFGVKPDFLQPHYTIKVGFPRAPGVSKDTPIRKDGVPIGRVSEVALQDEGGVVMTMRIDEGRTLRMYERARISTGSLVTGDAVVEWVRDMDDPNDEVIEDGDLLPNHGSVANDPLQIMIEMEGRMTDAFTAIEVAGNSMAQLFGKMEGQLDRMLDDEQIQRILQSAEDALDGITLAADAVEDLVGDEELKRKLEGALEEFQPLLSDARTALQQIQDSVKGFEDVGPSLQRNLDNFEKITGPLARDGAAEKLSDTIGNLDRVFSEAAVLVSRVNRGEGTLGRLTRDEELFDQLQRIVASIEYITKRARPIVDDVRIITDKAARDPGSIGVPGLLDSRMPGLKRAPH